jgi:hypothetical protein
MWFSEIWVTVFIWSHHGLWIPILFKTGNETSISRNTASTRLGQLLVRVK